LGSFILLFTSCGKGFENDNFKAYFGGEVVNPVNRYVLFCKGTEVIDTIPLEANNTFFKEFKSLEPGLYTFRHDPEYQYVYFEKNDSLMVHINTKNFDESIVFCGRGDQKNNFLMEIFLKNENDRDDMYASFDYDVDRFTKAIDSTYNSVKKFYSKQKEELQWSEGFDTIARAAVDFHYYAKKERYPIAHHMRTGNDIFEKIPGNFYDFRKTIDFNNAELSNFSPFVTYLSHMLNNTAAITYHNHYSQEDLALKTNIHKLQIADTLFKEPSIKNTMLNNIAFTYLLEDQNMANNKKFLEAFHKYSTDDSSKNEITKIGDAIQLLETGRSLPEVDLVDVNGNTVSSNLLLNKKTIVFCWTEKLNSHFIAAHRKVLELKAQYPEYQIVAVNVDDNQEKWTGILATCNFPGIVEMRAKNFNELKDKWAINKIHRTIVLGDEGTIKNAFTNLFDVHFDDNLKLNAIHPKAEHALTSR
jgi:hypothetical protein